MAATQIFIVCDLLYNLLYIIVLTRGIEVLLLFFLLFSVVFFDLFLLLLARGIRVIRIHLHPLTLLSPIDPCYLIALIVFVGEARVLYVAGPREFQSIEDVVVAGDDQVACDHQLIESIIVPLDYQSVDLLIGVGLREYLIVVARDDHGLDVTRHLHPIVVPVHREILDVVPDSFRTVVLVDRV